MRSRLTDSRRWLSEVDSRQHRCPRWSLWTSTGSSLPGRRREGNHSSGLPAQIRIFRYPPRSLPTIKQRSVMQRSWILFDKCNCWADLRTSFETPISNAGPREKLLESFLKQTIEGAVILTLHPRTVISITVQVESPDSTGKASVSTRFLLASAAKYVQSCLCKLSPRKWS